jgi:hypothetical protein
MTACNFLLFVKRRLTGVAGGKGSELGGGNNCKTSIHVGHMQMQMQINRFMRISEGQAFGYQVRLRGPQ